MRYKPHFLLAFFLMILIDHAFAQKTYQHIRNYKVSTGLAVREGLEYVILRQFNNEDSTYLLLTDPATLKTRVDEAASYSLTPMSMEKLLEHFNHTLYNRTLQQVEANQKPLQNAGITHGAKNEKGVSLTTDLCPSHMPLDKSAYTKIIAAFEHIGHPVPVTVSISGLWIEHHPGDLEWLKKQQEDQKLAITWMNHSFYHHFDPKAPLERNFMLLPGTDINFEVLENEKEMLKNGLTPSLYFRFPGLVSGKELVKKIAGMGLVPVSADAWLAKGDKPRNGSIVLIHTNGNEPGGVQRFSKLLQAKAGEITSGQWKLYGLNESLSARFEKPE